MSKWLFCAVAMLMGMSCATSHRMVRVPVIHAPTEDLAILDSIKNNHFSFEWLQARGQMRLHVDDDQRDFQFSLRMRRDSILWISLAPITGLEAVRLLLNTDSVYIINRLEKKKFVYSYDLLEPYAGQPLSLQKVQSFLVGDIIRWAPAYRLARSDAWWTLISADAQFGDSLAVDSLFLPVYHRLTFPHGNCTLYYQQYDIQYSRPFAMWRKAEIHADRFMSLEINFTKVKLNEATRFPFRMEE